MRISYAKALGLKFRSTIVWRSRFSQLNSAVVSKPTDSIATSTSWAEIPEPQNQDDNNERANCAEEGD